MAAAVVLDAVFAEREEHGRLDGLTDSKQLSAARRESFYEQLTGSPSVDIGVGVADVAEIDRLNILKATHLAMARALNDLPSPPEHVLVDGLPVPGLPVPSTAIVRGDGKSLLIAAASVVAKVVRDRWMRHLDVTYPEYGFAEHKGYASQAHIQALFEHGPCPVHRLTFRTVRTADEIQRRRRGIQTDLFDTGRDDR